MRYKVVLVPFPFDDFSGQKLRPAVCLSDAIGEHHHVVVAFITSVTPSKLESTDILLSSEIPGFTNTGLRVSSTLRLHRIVTVSASIIKRQLGVLGPEIQTQVQERLKALFTL